ncbi:MAG: preprotein translocase subunit SecE [Candidatus Calescibacterium sp.]|nr:preprotein translocase subunit SecE [Candidatus Calescibacterium sp.]MDW8132622.1 preprotein translocase subunit SecE [Candidatus Calescibacterium sp.]
MKKIIGFIGEVKEELQKIAYPDRQAVINATKSITIIVFFAAIYMEIIDFILKSIFKYVLKINL